MSPEDILASRMYTLTPALQNVLNSSHYIFLRVARKDVIEPSRIAELSLPAKPVDRATIALESHTPRAMQSWPPSTSIAIRDHEHIS